MEAPQGTPRRCPASLHRLVADAHGANGTGADGEEEVAGFQALDGYVAAREPAARAHALPPPDAELRDQLRRASGPRSSTWPKACPPTRRASAGALSAGSLCEAAAALDLASAIGLAEPREAASLIALAARLKRMLRRL